MAEKKRNISAADRAKGYAQAMAEADKAMVKHAEELKKKQQKKK